MKHTHLIRASHSVMVVLVSMLVLLPSSAIQTSSRIASAVDSEGRKAARVENPLLTGEEGVPFVVDLNWKDTLDLLNEKRGDVGKEPISVATPETITKAGVQAIRSGTEEILSDYGFSSLADALRSGGYDYDMWFNLALDEITAYDKAEVANILNRMLIVPLSLQDLTKDSYNYHHSYWIEVHASGSHYECSVYKDEEVYWFSKYPADVEDMDIRAESSCPVNAPFPPSPPQLTWLEYGTSTVTFYSIGEYVTTFLGGLGANLISYSYILRPSTDRPDQICQLDVWDSSGYQYTKYCRRMDGSEFPALSDPNLVKTGGSVTLETSDFATAMGILDSAAPMVEGHFTVAYHLSTRNCPSDFRITPGQFSGEIELDWLAPCDSDGNAVAQYDIRYSNNPITESNWGSASQLSGEPTPDTPGKAEFMFIGKGINTRWYFGLKSIDKNGGISALSTVPSIQDLGFRADPNGYDFDNWNGIFPFGDYDYTNDSLINMFGQANVCLMVGSVCYVRPSASSWKFDANKLMRAGHCYGMASTSTRFFNNTDNPAKFQPGAIFTHDLFKVNSRKNIAYNHVLQLTEPSSTEINQTTHESPSTIVNDLYTMVDPPILYISLQNKRIAHAITPYAIVDQGDGTVQIYVYDNNHRNNNDGFVLINMIGNTWSYAYSTTETWSGDNTTHSFGYVPISFSSLQPDCPWCDNTQSAQGVSSSISNGQVWATGGQLLIKNQLGQRIGYDGTSFVNEIPDAYANPLIGGLDEAEPIYSLPLTDTYTITLDGQELVGTEPASVSQFGPGYAVSASDDNLTPISQDQIVFAPDGKSITYTAGETDNTTLSIALDTTTQSYAFTIQGADVTSGSPVNLGANLVDGKLMFDNSQGGNSTYAIEITRVDNTGKTIFSHGNIIINGNDTQYFDFGSWTYGEDITICTDVGSDGSIDDCQPLGNEFRELIYLPLISK